MLRSRCAEKSWLKQKKRQLLSVSFHLLSSAGCDRRHDALRTVNMQQGLAGSGHTGLSSLFSIKPQTTN